MQTCTHTHTHTHTHSRLSSVWLLNPPQAHVLLFLFGNHRNWLPLKALYLWEMTAFCSLDSFFGLPVHKKKAQLYVFTSTSPPRPKGAFSFLSTPAVHFLIPVHSATVRRIKPLSETSSGFSTKRTWGIASFLCQAQRIVVYGWISQNETWPGHISTQNQKKEMRNYILLNENEGCV